MAPVACHPFSCESDGTWAASLRGAQAIKVLLLSIAKAEYATCLTSCTAYYRCVLPQPGGNASHRAGRSVINKAGGGQCIIPRWTQHIDTHQVHGSLPCSLFIASVPQPGRRARGNASYRAGIINKRQAPSILTATTKFLVALHVHHLRPDHSPVCGLLPPLPPGLGTRRASTPPPRPAPRMTPSTSQVSGWVPDQTLARMML